MPKKTQKTTTPRHRKSSPTGWKLEELQKLIEGVKRYRITDYERIQKLVPTRTVAQVEAFLRTAKVTAQVERSRLRTIAANNGVPPKVEKEAPIESWLDLASEIVHYEAKDYSKMMGVVLSMISHYEEFPEPQSPLEPDYRKIYRYLSALLDDGELPALNQIESAVMLGLMEELQEQLRGPLDLGLHRKLLLWKYSMLNDKVDLADVKQSVSCSRQVFSNDFSQIVPIPDLPRPPESSTRPCPTLGEVLERIFQRSSAEEQGESMAAEPSASASQQREAGDSRGSLPWHLAEPSQTQSGIAQCRRGRKRKRVTANRGAARKTTTLANSRSLPAESPSCSAILIQDSDASNQETPSQSGPSPVNHHPSSTSSTAANPVEEEGEDEHPCATFSQEAQNVSNEDGTCEILHWPDPGYELHLVHNPITASTRAEPCCCTTPRQLLPPRQEDWPLFFYESEVAELRRLSGQSKSRKHKAAGPSGAGGAGEAGESTSDTIWDFGEERSYQRCTRGRQPIHPELRTIKKPRLLTLNPFHIPVEMIKLKKCRRDGGSDQP